MSTSSLDLIGDQRQPFLSPIIHSPTKFPKWILYIIPITVVFIVLVLLLGVSIIIIVVVVSNAQYNPPCSSKVYPLLLISLDGFRRDYLDSGLVPNLLQLSQQGVSSEYLLSQFPTKTFPNHYSIVTGLHPNWHGIVDNKFFDPISGQKFSLNSRELNAQHWWKATAIWSHVKESGLKSASYFWPGSEVINMTPNYYYQYNYSTPLTEQLSQIEHWLNMNASMAPIFIAVYYRNPDHFAHKYGVYSNELNDSLRMIDSVLGSFLSSSKLANVNKIVVSDHGFANISSVQVVFLTGYIDANLINFTRNGPVMGLNFKDKDRIDEAALNISQHPEYGRHFLIYKRHELPPRLHIGLNPRYSDLIIVAVVGWQVYLKSGQYSSKLKGTHGWDNYSDKMRALFLASGPSFKNNYFRSDGFENIELYNLMCSLLNIQPHPNNGTTGLLNDLLLETNSACLSTPHYFPGTPDVSNNCPFPKTSVIIENNSLCNSCLCPFCANNQENINKLLRLNLSMSQINNLKQNFIPGGFPQSGGGSNYCILVNPDSIIKFSNRLQIPMWVAYKSGMSTSTNAPSSQCEHLIDPRIAMTSTSRCSYYSNANNYTLSSLLPKQHAPSSYFLLSATLPILSLPIQLLNRSQSFINNYPKTLVVITGAILDANGEDVRSSDSSWVNFLTQENKVAVPSHVYQILIECINGMFIDGGCSGELNAMGLIIENKNITLSDELIGSALTFRYSTVRDIERLSGVNFFPNLSAEEQIRIELKITNKFWK